jgi:hypothetical protein
VFLDGELIVVLQGLRQMNVLSQMARASPSSLARA